MIQGIRSKLVWLSVALIAGFAAIGAASAPQYASLSRDKAFMREGPSYQHRIIWIYHRKELPMQVIASYDVWRKVRDSDGTVGWLHSSMLSDRRTIVVTSRNPAKIRDSSSPDAKVIAFAQRGVVARLEACEAETCEVTAAGTEGWIKKQNIWGVGVSEVFK